MLIQFVDLQKKNESLIPAVSEMQWNCKTVWVRVCSYPEGAPLTELKHPKHTVLKLHRAIELGQVVVIYTQQLKREDMEARRKWQEGEVGQKELKKKKKVRAHTCPAMTSYKIRDMDVLKILYIMLERE